MSDPMFVPPTTPSLEWLQRWRRHFVKLCQQEDSLFGPHEIGAVNTIFDLAVEGIRSLDANRNASTRLAAEMLYKLAAQMQRDSYKSKPKGPRT